MPEMTFLDAAYEVLKQAARPLHYTEIAARALGSALISTEGQTPEATMASLLYVNTKRPNSHFKRAGRGSFTLAETPSSDIAQQIRNLNAQTRATLRKRLLQMPPDRFEFLIRSLLIELGFDDDTVEVTSYSGDGGIDVRGILRAGGITQVNAAAQVKRWKHNVQARTVRDLRGSLKVHEQGIVITTSGFSSGARQEAQEQSKTRISLIDGEQLLDLLMRHGVGVAEEQYTVFSLDDEWWNELIDEPVSPLPEPSIKVTDPPTVQYPLGIQALVHGQTFEAQLLDPNGRVLFRERVYNSPSAAGQAASGWKSCNGWVFWRYSNRATGEWRPIHELRMPSP